MIKTNQPSIIAPVSLPSLSLLASTILVFGILASSSVSADVTSEIDISIPVSCSIIGTGEDSHHDEIINGASSSNIGTTTMDVFCNDNEGFAVYAIGYTNDEEGNNTLSNPSLDSSHDIVTGIQTSGNTSNWAMKLSATTGTYTPIIVGSSLDTEKEQDTPDFSSFTTIPDEFTRVAYRDSRTDVGTEAEGSIITSTYQVYVSKTQAAGTYVGQVKYVVVHPADEIVLRPQTTEAGKICYYPNGSKVLGTMGCQNVASSVTLLASNYSREGYGFAGWSDTYDYTGNFYGPNETISLTTANYSTTGLSLYAVWVKSVGSLQDSTKVAELCGTGTGSLTQASTTNPVTLASVSALTDERDNETYAIAKLADGNCWMIENLRIEADATRGDANKALAQGYGVSSTYGNFIGLADAENTGFENSYSANNLYSNDGSNNTVNIGTSSYPVYRMPRYNNLNTPANANNRPQRPTSNTYLQDNTTVGMYSYGNYYTWAAAMASTISYGSNYSDNANTSLCPLGWRIPYGSNTGNGAASGGFSYLDVRLGGTGTTQNAATASNRWRKFPNNFLYSGYFNASSAKSRGSFGSYWSSTATGTSNLYSLSLSTSQMVPGNYNWSKYSGNTIRCVRRS